MSTDGGQVGIKSLREFLDDLPLKPCPSKLPENYCKICRRLNGEVARACGKKGIAPQPTKEALEERKQPEIERRAIEDVKVQPMPTFQPASQPAFQPMSEPVFEPAPKPEHKRTPILERPVYEEGETSLEFVPSQKSIDDAKKSLPRFIPVQKRPRAFTPLEELPEEPSSEEIMAFDLERPSIFKSPDSFVEEEEEMFFSLVSGVGAIEVSPLEIDAENTVLQETVFESSEGVVEAVDISEGREALDIEVEPPVFEFIDEGEMAVVDAEIVEVETVPVEELPLDITAEVDSLLDSIEAELGVTEISEPTEEIRFMIKEEEIEERAAEEPQKALTPKKKLKKKKLKVMKPKEPKEGVEAEIKPEPSEEIITPEEIETTEREGHLPPPPPWLKKETTTSPELEKASPPPPPWLKEKPTISPKPEEEEKVEKKVTKRKIKKRKLKPKKLKFKKKADTGDEKEDSGEIEKQDKETGETEETKEPEEDKTPSSDSEDESSEKEKTDVDNAK